MNQHLFISYRSVERDFALKLAQDFLDSAKGT